MTDELKQNEKDGEVVYRRLAQSDETPPQAVEHTEPRPSTRPWSMWAPSLKPLLIAFALLLGLIGLLGYFSRDELNNVESGTSLFQTQYRNKVKQLLNLHASAIRLDSEARTRSAAETRGELTPPFKVPITKARAELEEQLASLGRMPFANEEDWRLLRERLIEFINSTDDLRQFSLEGYAKFREVEAQVTKIENELNIEPRELNSRTEDLRNQSAKRIKFWWITALLGGLIVVVATFWEVQRRFRHEQQSLDEARRERQFSTQMLEGMISAVAAIDSHAHIRSANAAFFELFPEAYVGMSVYSNIERPEARRMLEVAISQRAEAAGYRGRWSIEGDASKSGRLLSCDLYSAPLEIDGEEGQIITLIDVTDAVEAEAMMRRSEALAAVGQASAQVAHEIRNPLGSIRLGVSMLRDMTNGKEALTTIDLVERGIDHLNKLVVDVTQFSREKPLSRSAIDLHRLINSSLELVADRIGDKRPRIEKRFGQYALSGAWDEDQLRQVFVNLLANAIDASKQGAAVTVATERVMPDAVSGDGHGKAIDLMQDVQIARVTISDEGEGMDEATRSRIFEPFFTTKKRGTGLGLAIVKQIVERHGGTISVETAPGKGSRFVIDLPTKAIEMAKRQTV